MLENEMRELPEDIGPHEGKEFMLMRAGEKDVALFFEIEPEELSDVLSEGFRRLCCTNQVEV